SLTRRARREPLHPAGRVMTPSEVDLFVDGAIVTTTGRAAIYGAGGAGRDLLTVLRRSGIDVRCLLDRTASPGQRCGDVPVFTLDSCPLAAAERADIPVVIGIFNRDVDIPAVGRALRDAGFRRVVSFVGIHAQFPGALGDRFWLTDRHA